MTDPTTRELIAAFGLDVIDPKDWALVVCVGRRGFVEVHGHRTRKAAEALRAIADQIEANPS